MTREVDQDRQRVREVQRGFTIVELLIVVVVVAILAAITIVSYNGITNQARQATMKSEISQWKKQSEIHKIQNGITCPENYALVYGNAALGSSDFCVMKYEAKNVGGVATSQAAGTPWVSISQTNAITAAAAACDGCHLITEAEWMTIAADVLSVKYNWSGWAVGSGYIYSGHNDMTPANALGATSSDDDAYAGTGNSASLGTNQKRTLYLSTGDVIWDLAGNVWEWTGDTVAGALPGLPSDSGDGITTSWKQWNASGMTWGNLSAESRPSALAVIPGLSGVTSWTSTNGIGQLLSNRNHTSTRAIIRGGTWGATSPGGTGILTLNVSSEPAALISSVGFRAAK